MSRINELIRKLCPNGVEYKKMWQITTWDKKYNSVDKYMQPKIIKYNYLLANQLNEIIVDNGDVFILETGINNTKKYTNEDLAGDNLCNGEIIAIPWGGTPNVKYYNGKFVTGDNRIAVSNDINVLNTKFLYYIFENKMNEIADFYRGSGIKHPEMKKVLNLDIPVPPIKVQEEIVRILDKFGELEAELEARKSQYEFWRGKLLNDSNNYKKLGELCSIKTGSKPQEILEHGEVEYINAGTTNSGYTIEPNAKGDCVTTPSRGQGGIGFVGYQINDFWCGPLCYQIRSLSERLSNRYLYYYMSANSNYIIGLKHEGGVPAVNVKELQEMPIRVPAVEEQIKIVNILDRFDKLIYDITVGLPAEIELRRKQYEYYRNKLLSFEEMSVSE